MSEQFFAQKIKTLFTRFDQDKNGKIEVDDFEKWSASLAKIGNLNSERSVALQKSLFNKKKKFVHSAFIFSILFRLFENLANLFFAS